MTEPVTRPLTVTDHDSNPLENVRVWLYDAGDRNSSNPLFRDGLWLATDIGILTTLTDDQGQAVFTNLPKNPNAVFTRVWRDMPEAWHFPADEQSASAPGATIKGRVLAENETPVEGAKIRFHTDWMWESFFATTDADGTFTFKDLPAKGWDMSPWGKSEEPANGLYKITVKHKLYSIPGEEIQLLPGDNITDFVINAYSDGTLIKCKVVDSDTSIPLAGVRVQGSSASGRIDDYTDEDGDIDCPRRTRNSQLLLPLHLQMAYIH